MPTLGIDVSRFRGLFSGLNGSFALNINRTKCIKFAQAVGNSHFSRAFGRTETALSLSTYRAMAVSCVLDFTKSKLRRSDHYRSLESSEKINLSYWIGMTFAAIAADQILGVSRLTHASRQSGLVKKNKKSKSLADLVGQDASGNWHVIEAKGRQTAPSKEDRSAWKEQAETVRKVNSKAVSTRSYCVGLIDDPCSILLVDPPPRPNSTNLIIKESEVWEDYYAPYREFLKRGFRTVKRGNRGFALRAISFDPVNFDYIYAGLDRRLLSLTSSRSDFGRGFEEFDDEKLYVGKDGVAIATSSRPYNLR